LPVIVSVEELIALVTSPTPVVKSQVRGFSAIAKCIARFSLR